MTLENIFLWASCDFGCEPNQLSCVKTKNKFKSQDVEIALGGVVQPELSFRRQAQEIDPHFNLVDTKIYFQAQYLQDHWSIGYRMRLDPSVNEIKVGQNYIEFFHKSLGTFHLGCRKGVHDNLAKLAQRNMPTIRIYGGLDEHIERPLDAYAGNDLEGHSSNAFKFNWLSPYYLGFRFAFTYAPQTKKDNASFNEHHFTVAFSYKKQFGDFAFQAAGALLGDFQADREKAFKEQKHRALSYMISASLGWKSLKGAFEFLNNGISRTSLFSKVDTAGKALNISVSYAINDSHTIGIGGQYTWRYKDKRYDKWLATIGYAYKVFECMTWYAEGSFLSYHSSEAKPINQGFVLRTGLRIEI